MPAPSSADARASKSDWLNIEYFPNNSFVPSDNVEVYFAISEAPLLIFDEPLFNSLAPLLSFVAPFTNSSVPSFNSSIFSSISEKSNVSFKSMSPNSDVATVSAISIEKSLTSAVTVTLSGISMSLM